MSQELAQLEAELAKVLVCELEYLPNYGYSPKAEIINLIEEDIESVKAEISANEFDYTDDELECERTQLCMSLGIARIC